MIRRSGRILAGLVAAVLLIALASSAWLAGTETGTRWLLRQGLDRVPGQAGFAASEGSLISGLRITGLEHEAEYGQLRLDELRLDTRPFALLAGVIDVRALTLQGLSLELAPENRDAGDPAPSGTGSWPVLALPLPLVMDQVEVRDLRIRRNGNRHAFTRLALAGQWRGRELELDHLALQQQQRHLNLSGAVTFGQPWRIDADITWGLPLPASVNGYFDQRLAFGQGRIRGPVNKLTLDHRLHRPQPVRTRGTVQPLDQPLQLDLTHEWPALEISLPDGRRLALAEGRLETRGSPDDYMLALDAGPSALEGLPALRPRLRARGDGDSLRIRELLLAGNPGRLRATGAVAWQPQLSWNLSLDGEQLNPAFLDERIPGRLALNAQLNGQLPEQAPLALELDLQRLEGEVRGETLHASGRASMTGTEQARIHALELTTRHGNARVRGTAGWAPHPRWDLDVQGEDWNPAVLDPRLPGRIRLNARVSGELAPQAPPALELNLAELDGVLREQPLSGGGDLSLRGLERVRGDLNLGLGENRVTLQGYRGEQSDLEMEVQAPDLAPLWPELAGTLQGRVRFRGSLADPVLEGNLEGRDLAFRQWSLARLDLDMTPPTANSRQTLTLSTADLRQREQFLFRALTLELRGTAGQHRLDWSLEQADHRLTGVLAGGIRDRDWRGELRNLRLSGSLSGAWQQAKPASLEASRDRLRLDEFCLAGDPGGRICTRGHWQDPDEGELGLSLAAVPLAPLNAFLPAGAGLEGQLDGEAELRLIRGEPRGQARLTSDNGAVRISADREEPVRLSWRKLNTEARLDAGEWRIDTDLALAEDDHVRGHVQGRLEPSGTQLDGRLDTRLTHLAWLELLIPRLRAPQGRLEGSLALSGTPEQPVFDGGLELRDGRVQVPRAGLALRNMHMSARTDDRGRLQFDGGARSGDGRVRVTGALETDQSWPWPLELHLEGEQFLALDRPETRLVLNPDLELTLAGQQLNLRGRVGVPSARFAPRELQRGAVQVSSDVHLVDGEEQAVETWKPDIDVDVELGDDVRFNGFGLEARFAGAVRYLDRVEQVPRMTGEMRIAEGRYRAWGQHLEIERGRLLFEGSPDNPGLDIVAVRPLPERDVRVGLEVAGTLQDPDARVFSDPPREQSEAMALLLTGRPLSGTSQAESDAILQAVTRYGLERGEFLTNPLSESLGVEVGVNSGTETSRTALTLGKQLSERLYVQYSMGLFESLSTVMLRYSITRRLSLETRSSGESQGADLIYRLQRD